MKILWKLTKLVKGCVGVVVWMWMWVWVYDNDDDDDYGASRPYCWLYKYGFPWQSDMLHSQLYWLPLPMSSSVIREAMHNR